MNWADFYLICFVVGFAFSVLLFLSGGLHFHLPFRWHFPHIELHHGGSAIDVGHTGSAPAHAPGVAQGAAANGPSTHAGTGISPFNFLTLTVFLAWFGGTGYLLTRYSGAWFALTLVLSVISGFAAARIIFWFLARLMKSEKPLDPADFEMVGVLGKITSAIREGGTGEITYSQAGTRRACGARAENGRAIPRGTEVVVMRYERGIAYVRLWEEMAPELSSSASDVAAASAEPPNKSS